MSDYVLNVGEPADDLLAELPEGDARRETFNRWLMVRHERGKTGERSVHLFVDHTLKPSDRDFERANERLFGESGSVELYMPDGRRFW